MSTPSILSALALVVAVGSAGLLYKRNAELDERLAAVEAQRTLAAHGEVHASGKAPVLTGSAAQRDLAELQGLAEGLVRRMDAIESAQPAAETDAGSAARVAALTGSAEFTDAVRGVVLDMATNDVDFRARVGTNRRTEIPKDAPFSRVAEVLKLDASQEDRLSKDLQEMQQELFGLLSEERDDGVVPMEMIAKAEKLKEGDPKRSEYFMRLFTLKIPGEEETYMQRAVKLQTAFRKKTLEYLRPEQNEIWDSVKVDWFSIKFN